VRGNTGNREASASLGNGFHIRCFGIGWLDRPRPLRGSRQTQRSGPGPAASAEGEVSEGERIPGLNTRMDLAVAQESFGSGGQERDARTATACWHAAPVGSGTSVHGTVGKRQNSRRVKAAVMRYCYWRAEFFGGCERVAGKDAGLPSVVSFGWLLMGAQSGNAANSIRFRGATNPGPVCGVNRRGGEKPRGRNESVAWQRRAERWQQCRRGVDAQQESSEEGLTHEDESQERRTDPDVLRSMEGRSGAIVGASKATSSS
jgi:hypothetical protein